MADAVVVHRTAEVVVHEPQQFYAGDDWEIEALCTNADGTPINLVEAQSVTWLLNDITGEENIITLTDADGITIEVPVSGDNVTGRAYVQLGSDQTAGIAPGFYRDELSVVTKAGIRTTQFAGRIEVLAKLRPAVSGG